MTRHPDCDIDVFDAMMDGRLERYIQIEHEGRAIHELQSTIDVVKEWLSPEKIRQIVNEELNRA